MRRYACPHVHKIHNGHAFMISKTYKRVHLPVYSTCLVMVITMPFTKRLCAGFKNIRNKNLSQTKQLSQKGNQDLWLDKSMVWRSLHHKEILVSEPGRNRRECILTRNSPFPSISRNIASSLAYCVFILQLLRYARSCSFLIKCFIMRSMRIYNKTSRQGCVLTCTNRTMITFFYVLYFN